MKILNLMKKIDIFGRSVELRVDKKKKHKTYCGAFMTLLVMTITISVTIIYVKQFTNFDNPYLRIYDLKISEELNHQINGEYGSGLQIGLFNSDTSLPIDSSLIVVVAKITNESSTEGVASPINFQQQEISLIQCNDGSDMLCLKDSRINVLPYSEIGVAHGQNLYFQLFIYDCLTYKNKYQDYSKICKTANEIQVELAKAIVVLNYNEYEVNPKKYNGTIELIKRKYQRKINQNQVKEVDLIFQQIIVQTDRGIVWEANDITEVNSYYQTVENGSASIDDSQLISLKFLTSSQKQYYERSYSKIQVYIAYIGGIMKILTVLGEFFTRPFVRLSLNTKIVNEIFDFEGGQSQDETGDLLSYEDLQQELHEDDENNQINPKYQRSSYVSYYKQSPMELDNFNLNNEISPIRFPSKKENLSFNQPNFIKIQKSDTSSAQNLEEKLPKVVNRTTNISVIQEQMLEGVSSSTPLHPSINSKQAVHRGSFFGPNNQTSLFPKLSLLGMDRSIQVDFQQYKQLGLTRDSNYNLNYNKQQTEVSIDNKMNLDEIEQDLQKEEELKIQFVQNQNIFSAKNQGEDTPQRKKRKQQIELSIIEDRESFMSKKRGSSRVKQEEKNPISILTQEKEKKVKNGELKGPKQKLKKQPKQENKSVQRSQSSSQSSSSSSGSSSMNSSHSQLPPSSEKGKNTLFPSEYQKVFQRSFLTHSMHSHRNEMSLSKQKTHKRPSLQSNYLNSRAEIKEQKLSLDEDINISSFQTRFKMSSPGKEIESPPQKEIVSPEKEIESPEHATDVTAAAKQMESKELLSNSIIDYQKNTNKEKSILKNNKMKQRSPDSQEYSLPYFESPEPRKKKDGIIGLRLQLNTKLNINNNCTTNNNINNNSSFEQNSQQENNQYPSEKASPYQVKLNNRTSLASGSSSPGKLNQPKFFCFDTSAQIKDPQNHRTNSLPQHKSSTLFSKSRNSKQGADLVNEGNGQRNSISPEFRRQGSRKYSTLEKKKILALTKLMDNYQNHKETKLDELKDFGKLVHSPKKKMKNPDSIFKRLFRQSKALKLKFFDYCFFYLQFFSKLYSEKKKQIKFSKEKVKERLDLVYIIQKLVEVDKLKILLLNEDQLKLFEYLPKPIVHMTPKIPNMSPQMRASNAIGILEHPANMQQAWSMLHQQKKPIEKAAEAQRVYQKMIDQDINLLSETDKKLIDMLDIRIKEIFDVNNLLQRQKSMNIINDSRIKDPSYQFQKIDPNPISFNPKKNSLKQRESFSQNILPSLHQVGGKITVSCPDKKQNQLTIEGTGLGCDDTQAVFLDQDPLNVSNNKN